MSAVDDVLDDAVLDDVVAQSLAGAHASLAQRRGRVVRFAPDVSPFGALPADATARDWDDAARLVGPGGVLALTGDVPTPPPGWTVVFDADGVQMVDESLRPEPFPEAVRLGAADVPDALALVERTRPGPFLARTVELGTYLGVRSGGRLVAMAGERLHPRGFTEISAVCTDADQRGRGLATRLVLAIAHGVRERGETPFLHAAGINTGAIRLYSQLGFRLRRATRFTALQPPALPPTAHQRQEHL